MSSTQPQAVPDRADVVIERLRDRFGDRVSTGESVLDMHGRDEGWLAPKRPDAVVFPHTTEEVAEVVRLCAAHDVPVIPYGTGTSLEGHVIPQAGGVTVDLSQMNRVLRVSAEDLDCTVEAGVTRKRLNEHLRDTGLFFPIDPGADASLGGMAATRASGTNAVRYGTMRENVMGLTVVLADGRVIRTGTRARKSSAGYDLTRLFVGSEGTLGVITEVMLRLYGIPEKIAAAVCRFPTLEAAVDTVILTIQSGIPVARIELLNEVMIRGVNTHDGLGLPEQPTLFLEFHGTEAGVAEQVQQFGAIAGEFGAGEPAWATTQEERNRLWQARHNAHFAVRTLRPGAFSFATDVCVPISRLADCILETRADAEANGFQAPIVGHVGDGNFHMVMLIDREDAADVARARAVNDRLIARALAMGGTATGEHGIGLGKQPFLAAEHGAAVEVMRALKHAIDPQGLFNPGKILPPREVEP